MGNFPEEWTGKAVGAILREAREARGASLDDAARVTRIGKNYLVALESDSYDRLPNPAYIKGFMRIYAGYLGLSGDELIARYEAGTAAAATPQEPPKPVPSREGQTPLRGKGRWYLPLLLLLCVIVVSLFVGEREEKQAPAPYVPPVQPPAPSPVQQQATSVKPVAPSPTPTVETAPGATMQEGPRTPATGVVLRLKVNQDSFLTITIDTSVSQQYDLKAGDLIEWKGQRTFTLDLSNGGGVEAELNGTQLPPLGAPGKPAHVVLPAGETEKKTP